MKSIERTFKSRTKNLKDIREYIQNFLSSNKASREDIEKIILAIDEACTNKIKHAYKYNPDGDILISLELKDEIFKAEISDWGEKFEPEKIQIPNIQENYKSQKKGGFGIYLMNQLMDVVEYKFLDEGENKIILMKKIQFVNNEK